MGIPTHEKSRKLAPPAFSVHLIAAGSNESKAAVVELAAIHPTVSSVARIADGVRV